ncbi:MAG: MMPL family transporter [Deltaproteobacteria bacterium]|nr:MMPL family transporter [Deltaproteobacteria bacterium]MBW2386218.1 MMPL family transporter [Deltaproteobacteria bacterium]
MLAESGAWLWAGSASGLALGLVAAALRPAWVTGAPRLVLVLLGLCTLGAGAGLVDTDPLRLGVSIDPSTEPLLPANDPSRGLYESAVLDFGDDEVYAVAVECEEVFSEPCLGAIDRVSIAAARMKGVRSVSSLMDVTSFRWVPDEEWIEIAPFIEDVPHDTLELATLRARALHDPVYRRTLVAPDARSTAVNLSFVEMTDADFLSSHLDAQLGSILAAELGSLFPYHVAGRPHVKVHIHQGILRDLGLLIPAAIVVMAMVLWLFLGRLAVALLPLATALLANVWTFGLIGWLGEPLTLLTGLLSPMLLAIGCVYGVHVVARFEEEAVGAPDAAFAALSSLVHVRVPALIAGGTTVVGFAALLVSDVPAVVDFGVFSMFGIAASTFVAITGIPAALALLPLRPIIETERGRAPLARRVGNWLDAMLGKLASAVSGRARGLVVLWLGVAVVSAALLPRIEIDTDYLSYFDPRDPIRLDFEAVNRLLAGAVPLYVVLEGSGPGSFREPELLHAVRTLEERIAALPGVSRTLSLIDSLRKLNRAFHADDPAEERIPDSRRAVTELLFMMPKTDLSRFVTVDHGRANVIVRTGEVGSAAILELTDAIEQAIAATPLPFGAKARVTGNSILLSHSADGIARGQPLSVGLAAVAIFVLVSLGLRSLRLGAVAMIPNLIPVLVFFALLGAGVAPLSLPTSLIGSVALGIAIDDTVHFLVRYRDERRLGASPADAAAAGTRRVGRPIAITSVMLCLGFLVITGSRFATLQEFGMLSALTMAICLATDLVLLPAVLIRVRA